MRKRPNVASPSPSCSHRLMGAHTRTSQEDDDADVSGVKENDKEDDDDDDDDE